MLFKKLANSFAYRSGPLYQAILNHLPLQSSNKGTNTKWVMITMCSLSHLEMLRQSLNSIIQSWSEIPLIKIYSDGNTDINTIKKKFADYKGGIEIEDWSTCLDSLRDSKFDNLKKFAQKHVIGKKLALIVANAIHTPTLWWDCDILWFKPLPDPSPSAERTFFLKTSKDYQPAYSENMIPLVPGMLDKTFINTGLVLINGEIPIDDKLEELISVASIAPNHFSEQTIIAHLVHQKDSPTWSLDEIACHQSDQLSVKPTFVGKPWVARHYVGPVRHLFWRDAFYLRFKKV